MLDKKVEMGVLTGKDEYDAERSLNDERLRELPNVQRFYGLPAPDRPDACKGVVTFKQKVDTFNTVNTVRNYTHSVCPICAVDLVALNAGKLGKESYYDLDEHVRGMVDATLVNHLTMRHRVDERPRVIAKTELEKEWLKTPLAIGNTQSQ